MESQLNMNTATLEFMLNAPNTLFTFIGELNFFSKFAFLLFILSIFLAFGVVVYKLCQKDPGQIVVRHYQVKPMRTWANYWALFVFADDIDDYTAWKERFKKRCIRGVVYTFVAVMGISYVCESIRLYQLAVAQRVATVTKMANSACSGSMGWFSYFTDTLSYWFSWSYIDDHCLDYHKATMIDPIWDVNPILVLMSLFTRCILHPTKEIFSAFGKAIRSFFVEIPVQWQLLVMCLAFLLIIFAILVSCGYSITMPFLSLKNGRVEVTESVTKKMKQSGKNKNKKVASEMNGNCKKEMAKRKNSTVKYDNNYYLD